MRVTEVHYVATVFIPGCDACSVCLTYVQDLFNVDMGRMQGPWGDESDAGGVSSMPGNSRSRSGAASHTTLDAVFTDNSRLSEAAALVEKMLPLAREVTGPTFLLCTTVQSIVCSMHVSRTLLKGWCWCRRNAAGYNLRTVPVVLIRAKVHAIAMQCMRPAENS